MPQLALSWFDIAVAEFAKACAFFRRVQAVRLEIHDMGEALMALIAVGHGGIGGALQPTLGAVVSTGGAVMLTKTKIRGDFGYFAYFRDFEVNRVGLMSPS